MCGIAGLVLNNQKADPDLLSNMLESISYRGPDSQGMVVKENIAYGHRRLKIIDLSDHANQPMVSEDGLVTLIFNGEVYNFQGLREELKEKGHIFKTSSDTEVILKMYLEYGKESFGLLNGMFAFAICDERDGEVKHYLVRDRTGIKPLFYSYKEGHLIFSSELKPLMKTPWVEKNIDREGLFLFLKHGHVPFPKTILSGVEQLSPGKYLELYKGQLSTKSFFEISSLVKSSRPLNEEQALKEIDELLKEVTRDQVVSDLPVGCFLSGGIDSSLLVSYFSQISSSPIETFSIGYDEAEFSEARFAKEVADFFKTKHHEIIVKPKDLFNIIESIPKYYDQPFSDPTLMPTMLLCQFAKENVAVALSGDGGDELFFGYVYQEMLLRLKKLRVVPYPLRKILFGFLDTLLGSIFPGAIPLKVQQIRKFSEIFQFKEVNEFYQYFIGTIGPMRMDKISRLVKGHCYGESFYSQKCADFNEMDEFHRIEQLFYRTFLPDTVLAKTDRASMAYSLEVRVPFLDNRLLEFSSTLPRDLKYRGRMKKYLLRKLLQGQLPGELYNRPKQGFSIPVREWIRGDLKFLVEEHLSSSALKNSDYLDSIEVQKLVEAHMKNRANNSHLIWSLIMFEMWRKEYL